MWFSPHVHDDIQLMPSNYVSHRTERWRHVVLPLSAQFVCSARVCAFPPRQSNTRRWPNAGLVLAHRLWRWLSIKPALVQRFVFSGSQSVSLCCGESASIHFSPALSMVQAVKHETLTQCCTNVASPSTTLCQH